METNEPMFGTVKEGPDRPPPHALNIELHGDEFSRADESTVYHYYQLKDSPPDSERGRRLARR